MANVTNDAIRKKIPEIVGYIPKDYMFNNQQSDFLISRISKPTKFDERSKIIGQTKLQLIPISILKRLSYVMGNYYTVSIIEMFLKWRTGSGGRASGSHILYTGQAISHGFDSTLGVHG